MQATVKTEDNNPHQTYESLTKNPFLRPDS